MEYITDMKTSKEWSLADFDQNTGGKCFYCGSLIGGFEHVHMILDDGKKFLCTGCLEEPLPSLKEMIN